MSMAHISGSMLPPHDALDKGACNSEESGVDGCKFRVQGSQGNPRMTGGFRSEIVSRLSQIPAAHSAGALKPAAVLIPIIGPASDSVLLTLRTDHLESHAGQVCFPGGRFKPDDADL